MLNSVYCYSTGLLLWEECAVKPAADPLCERVELALELPLRKEDLNKGLIELVTMDPRTC